MEAAALLAVAVALAGVEPFGGSQPVELALQTEPVIAALPAVEDIAGEVRRSLDQPIGSPRLRDLVKPGKEVVVVGDDATRITPR